MREIRGNAKTIRELLSGAKYSVDYYQREYRWQTKHVVELIDDLTEKFLDSYDEIHKRRDVKNYGHYFMGSIIISAKDGTSFVIDGQQRLTTLTLLLIFLYRRLEDADLQSKVSNMIFSSSFGERAFNLAVPDRTDCMEALFTGKPVADSEVNESVRNIVGRHSDIEEHFAEDLVERPCRTSQTGSSRTFTSSRSRRTPMKTPTRSSRR